MKVAQLIPFLTPLLAQQVPLRIQEVAQPELDLSSFANGKFGLLGDFDAVSQYTYVGASNFTNQAAGGNNTLIYKNERDQFLNIGEVSGKVSSIIPLNGEKFLILGDFTSIGSHNASAPSILDLSSGEFENIPLKGSTTGLFDGEELLYLGGNFTFNQTQSVAIYNLTDSTLTAAPFRGFGRDSVVNSIVQIGSNIVFGGKFDTLGYTQLLSSSYNTSSMEVEVSQLVSLRYATFSSSDGSTSLDSLACPGSGDGWLVSETTAATFNIDLSAPVIPSKIRIYNSEQLDSQVSVFRLITIPADGIMNLTYVNPSTGILETCDAWCPLYNSTELTRLASDNTQLTVPFYDTYLGFSTNYQEFGFVNSLDVATLTFQALDSFGSSIGLSGFQLYQNNFNTYANNLLNQPTCGTSGDYSQSELIGNWQASGNGYLTAIVEEGAETGVIFRPNITYTGEYSILLYTPGCAASNSCAQRGTVNVTVVSEKSNEVMGQYTIYQTNNEDKYDSVFYGHLEGPVTVNMMLDSTLSPSGDVQLVADRIGTTILSVDAIVNKNGSIPMNGIFEYSPFNFTQLNPAYVTERAVVGNTTINRLGADLSNNAEVSLAFYDDVLIVAGDFESSTYGNNFIQVNIDSENSNEEALNADIESVDGGLNGAVSSLHLVSDGVVVYGNFDDTVETANVNQLVNSSSQSIMNVALFNGSWYSLPESFSSASSFANITLSGSEFWVFGDNKLNISSNSVFDDGLLLSFNASASARIADHTLFFGDLTQADSLVNKGFLTNGTNISNITDEEMAFDAINNGLFVNDSLSIFGGEFTTSAGISNLIFVEDNQVSGLNINWEQNSTVTKLFAAKEKLFIGSHGTGGQVSGVQFRGVLIYDLAMSEFPENQPAELSSSDSESLVVSEFGIFNNTYLIVGGVFDSAGDVSCSGFCFYNLNSSSWEEPLIHNFSGSVSSFRFVNDTLVCSGNLTYEDSKYSLLAYDFNNSEPQTIQPSAFISVPQTVNEFILVDNSTSGRMIVSNDRSISGYNGSQWVELSSFENGTIINDIQLLELSSPIRENDGEIFNSSQILLASGELILPTYGYTNLALFNGTQWMPYLITTRSTSPSLANSIFINKDISSLYQSGFMSVQQPLTSSSPSPSATSSHAPIIDKSGQMDRGFIVLVSLAAAVGTVSLLGAASAFILYKKRHNEYTPLEPRVNETEMLDTVPPENLLKHI